MRIRILVLALVFSPVAFAQPACIAPGPRVALTFDDGPSGARTESILQTLHQHGAQATFFLVGQNTIAQPDLAREIWNEGHELGVHTWSHKDLARISEARRKSEVQHGYEALHDTVPAASVVWWRAPYGSAPNRGQGFATEVGMRGRLWDVDTLDWQGPSAATIVHRVMSHVRDGDVVLMHDHGRHTPEAVGPLLDELQARGYRMTTVSGLALPTCTEVAPPEAVPSEPEPLPPNLEIIAAHTPPR